MVLCRCASICLQPFDETRLDCVSLLYTIIASDTCGLWILVFVNTSVPACVSNTFVLCPVSVFKHLSPPVINHNHVWFGALCRAQVSVSTRASNTFCGSWSVHIIGLQPFVSNTFDFSNLVCVPSRPHQNEGNKRRFYSGPELRISCQIFLEKE